MASPQIGRTLTVGEIHFSRQVFGDDLDYGIPRIINGHWFIFQPDDTAMTPNGNMYYPADLYRADFSKNRKDFFLFIHELTHCWQHQHGINVMVRGTFERSYDYGELKTTDHFDHFKLEQQASIVADYVRLCNGAAPIKGSGPLAAYVAVLPFLPK